MKKCIVLAITLMCCVSAFSTRYLVELGTGEAASWSAVSGTVINLSAEGYLNDWFNDVSFVKGDEIWIAAGTYELSGPIDLHRSEDGGRKLYSVYGGFAGTETNLEDRLAAGWEFTNETVLDGKGEFQIIKDGTSLSAGGYYAGSSGEYWVLNGLTLVNGTAENGAAMSVEGALKIQNCQFVANSATNNGGAINGEGARFIEVTNCYFVKNDAGNHGGAVCIISEECKVLNSIFEFNKALEDGGALKLGNWGTEEGIVSNCIFRGNIAQQGFGIASLRGSTGHAGTIVENCVFTNNSGTHQYHENDATLHILDGVTVVNSTIANNIGGIIFDNGEPTRRILINTLIYGNTNTFKPGALANDITNCAIDRDATTTGAILTDCIDLTALAASAIFENPTTFVGSPANPSQETALALANWSLKANSPCIDAGTATGAPAYDILGIVRPQEAGYDIGAYEFICDCVGIKTVENDEPVVSVRYYTLQGMEITKPERNQIYIVKSIFESGKTNVVKQIMR